MLARRLIEAGWYTVTPAQIVLRVVAGSCFGLVIALIIWNFLHMEAFFVRRFRDFVYHCRYLGAVFALNQAVENRKAAIQRGLPDFLDMVSSTVQAGLALNAAMNYAVEVTTGPLGEEIKEALGSSPRAVASEALKAAADRTNQQDFKTAVTTIRRRSGSAQH